MSCTCMLVTHLAMPAHANMDGDGHSTTTMSHIDHIDVDVMHSAVVVGLPLEDACPQGENEG